MVGMVVLDEGHPQFIGASRADSNAAEMSGFAWAIAFALQHTETVKHVAVHYDSRFAAHNADSTWRDGGYTQQPRVLSALYNILHTLTSVDLCHEKGHAGLPYNELVDSLCTWYGLGYAADTDCTQDLTPVTTLAKEHSRMQWIFLSVLPLELRRQYRERL